MSIPVKTTYVADSLLLFRQAHRGKKRTGNVLAAVVQQMQAAEYAFQSLAAPYDIDGSSGARLDAIGSMVGVDRNALDDASYRLLLLGEIAANKGNGLLQETLNVALKLFQSKYCFAHAPASAGMGPQARGGGIGLALSTPALPERLYPLARKLLERCLPAGINLIFLSLFDETKRFAFAGPRGWGSGFGSIHDPSKGAPIGSLRKTTLRSA